MSWTNAFAPDSRTVSFGAPVRLGHAAHQAVRLTRRGRLVVIGLLVGFLLAAFSLGRAGSSQAAGTVSQATPVVSTTVHSGETLWAVAQRVAPDVDPREVVAQLRRLNHLTTSSLEVGQQLVVPA